MAKSTDVLSDGSMASHIPSSLKSRSSDGIQASEITTISPSQPSDGIQASESPTVMVTEEGTDAAVPRCSTCSRQQILGYSTKRVRHEHFSSKILTDQAEDIEEGKNYFCLACDKSHLKFSNSTRRKICVTSAILPEDRESTAVDIRTGEVFHVDWICIPGARINRLTEAWEIEYMLETKPMDIILIGGLENVKRGRSGPSIVAAYEHFIDLVKWQGERYHPDEPNTCTIGTLVYPPQLCWFEDDGQVPPSFQNHLRNIKWLNLQIERMNDESGTKSPKFHTLGVRKVTRNGRGRTRHRLEHWEGQERADKFHLRTDQRAKMANQVARYYAHMTSL